MAPAFVQGRGFGNLGGLGANPTVSYSGNTTPGDLLILTVQTFAGSITLNSVTDSQGNTWVILPTPTAGVYNIYFAYALKTAGGANTVTLHFSSGPANCYGTLGEYSGVDTFRGVGAAGFTGSTGSATSGSLGTAVGDLLIGYAMCYEVSAPFGATTPGFTTRELATGVSNTQDGYADAIATSGSSSITWQANIPGGTGLFVILTAFFALRKSQRTLVGVGL
jgi:hypothetical protein